MRVVVYNHLGTGPEHEETFEGPPEHVEVYIRRAFPFLNREVVHGDLEGCLEAIDEQQLYSVEVQQGEHELVHHEPFLIKHLREQEEGESLRKMALVHDDPSKPVTLYRVQNEEGEGPYQGRVNGYSNIRVVSEMTGGGAVHVPTRPQPTQDFPSHEFTQFFKPPYDKRFAFERPEHAVEWFGQEALDEMKRYGYHLGPVQASRVWRSNSGTQVFYEPHKTPEAENLGKADVTQRPGFSEWFAGSKVAHPDGRPMVMYHGSRSGGFTEFQTPSWFTSSPESASGYAGRGSEGAQVFPVHLAIRNPARVSFPEFIGASSGLRARLIAEGHDGLVHESKIIGKPPAMVYVPFYPHQIKSVHAEGFDPAVAHIAKAEEPYTIPLDAEANLAWEMQGFQAQADALFDTARWMAGEASASPHHLRQSLLKHDGDIELAALAAYGLDLTEENLHALRGLAGSGVIVKAEPEPVAPPQSLIPAHPDASEAAVEIERGFNAGSFHFVNLNGKHSKGTMIGRDPESHHLYLLKPGSGDNSPALGVHEESASQSRREAAFWHVADLLGLGEYFPRADLIYIDGREVAAIRMLPTDYKNLGTALKQNPTIMPHIMRPYLVSGLLHKWGALDFILGNPDRHSQNMMVEVDKRSLRLIDHGSALAGPSFDPAHDDNSFIPYYLRCWTGAKFHSLEPAQQFRQMPTAGIDGEKALARWLSNIDPDRLSAKLASYGVDAQPEVQRLEELKMMPGPKDLAVNKLWLGIGTENPHT